jgi:hypothetical protein
MDSPSPPTYTPRPRPGGHLKRLSLSASPAASMRLSLDSAEFDRAEFGSPTASPSPGGARSGRSPLLRGSGRGGHNSSSVRRQSSISYSTSAPVFDSPSASNSNTAPSSPSERHVSTFAQRRLSLASERSHSPLSDATLGSYHLTRGSPTASPRISCETQEEDDEDNTFTPDSARSEQPGSASRMTNGVSARSGATLIEHHSELLSFIAKKERKCLDLREGRFLVFACFLMSVV